LAVSFDAGKTERVDHLFLALDDGVLGCKSTKNNDDRSEDGVSSKINPQSVVFFFIQ
jgi:hypothetical protein